MPTPQCAAIIMLTSLAPSPIASVYAKGFAFLIIVTISAFYFGDTLHPTTTLHLSPIQTNFSFRESSTKICNKESPVMMQANLSSSYILLSGTPSFYSWPIDFLISSLALSNSRLITSLSFPITASYLRVWSSSVQENPMFIAVSILSPVKTQIMIPAYFNIWIVFPTSSCNLSSIAVAPIRRNFFSIFS